MSVAPGAGPGSVFSHAEPSRTDSNAALTVVPVASNRPVLTWRPPEPAMTRASSPATSSPGSFWDWRFSKEMVAEPTVTSTLVLSERKLPAWSSVPVERIWLSSVIVAGVAHVMILVPLKGSVSSVGSVPFRYSLRSEMVSLSESEIAVAVVVLPK